MRAKLLLPTLLLVTLAGCVNDGDHRGEPSLAMAVEVSDSDATALPWTAVQADMPASVSASMDEAEDPTDPGDANNQHVREVTREEKAQIEQAYRSAWAERYGGDVPSPFLVERDGQTFAIVFMETT